jgi:hypothetical protein
MDTQEVHSAPTSASKHRKLGVAGLLAAGAIAGGVLAGTLTASAASGTPSPSSGSSTSGGGQNQSSTPVRTDEKAVGSTLESTLRTNALAAVPGGTIYRIESDAGDGAYEAHMTKANGTLVTVKFDKSGKVTQVEDGMGTGDPHGPDRSGPDGDGPGGGTTSG